MSVGYHQSVLATFRTPLAGSASSLVLALLLGGCGQSHDLEDCVEPAPAGCRNYDSTRGCCEAVPARCVDGDWVCPRPEEMGVACEETCGDAGASSCGGKSEAQCIAAEDCAPVYDDVCCPACTPTGACADCTQIEMYRCAPKSEACDGAAVCGVAPTWACEDLTGYCAMAMLASGHRCTEPGCVWVDFPSVEPSCGEVRGDSCEITCDVMPPPCGGGWVPEADHGCFTGNCIPESACVPPSESPAP
jgi:hypothetical protein